MTFLIEELVSNWVVRFTPEEAEAYFGTVRLANIMKGKDSSYSGWVAREGEQSDEEKIEQEALARIVW